MLRRDRFRALAGAAILLTLAVGLAACGGDDDAPPQTASPSAATTTTATASPSAAVTERSPAAETAPVLPATATDKDGKAVKVSDVSRIVVLNGDIAEVVYALGLGGNVVGLDTSATYPPEAAANQNIGYQRSLSAVVILSLNPSVLIGNEVAGPAAVIEQIRGAGVPVVIFKDITTLTGASDKITGVAAALGVPNRGKALVQTMSGEISAATTLAKTAKTEPVVAFLYLRGATTQMLMGAGSRADVLIAAANGVDAGVEAGVKGSVPITPEALVAAQPDVILVLSAGLQSVGGVDGLLQIPGVAQTPAGKNRAIVDLDDQYLLGLGPRTGQALMDLTKLIHPELK
jgi:iron complex transport system substrate-binding protein